MHVQAAAFTFIKTCMNQDMLVQPASIPLHKQGYIHHSHKIVQLSEAEAEMEVQLV